MKTKSLYIKDAFPVEFENHFLADLDRRFYGILLLSWLTIFSFVQLLGNLQYDPSAVHARIRQAYLDQISRYPVNLFINQQDKISGMDHSSKTAAGADDVLYYSFTALS